MRIEDQEIYYGLDYIESWSHAEAEAVEVEVVPEPPAVQSTPFALEQTLYFPIEAIYASIYEVEKKHREFIRAIIREILAKASTRSKPHIEKIELVQEILAQSIRRRDTGRPFIETEITDVKVLRQKENEDILISILAKIA